MEAPSKTVEWTRLRTAREGVGDVPAEYGRVRAESTGWRRGAAERVDRSCSRHWERCGWVSVRRRSGGGGSRGGGGGGSVVVVWWWWKRIATEATSAAPTVRSARSGHYRQPLLVGQRRTSISRRCGVATAPATSRRLGSTAMATAGTQQQQQQQQQQQWQFGTDMHGRHTGTDTHNSRHTHTDTRLTAIGAQRQEQQQLLGGFQLQQQQQQQQQRHQR